MAEERIRLPSSSQRLGIIGRTGSGKTLAGLWHLSNANFQAMPWVVVDYKTDEHIAGIERARYIGTQETVKQPGIYVVNPHPDDLGVGELFERIWMRGNTGVYVDEGYMVGEHPEVERRFKTLLTQGRSRRIPMIVLSQRPSWITRFVFSESDFFQVFHLNDQRDQKTIEAFMPTGSYKRLPDYHSIYYDVGRNQVHYLAPVPDESVILERIHARLKPIRYLI